MRFMGPSFARSRYDVPGLGGLTMGRESKVSSHPMIRSKRWPFRPFHGEFFEYVFSEKDKVSNQK